MEYRARIYLDLYNYKRKGGEPMEVLSFLWEIAKIGMAIGAARIAFEIYAYKKGYIIKSR